jgi:hypothetical protein
MIYCKPLSFCFIAVPKTGTTSIQTFLSTYCDEYDIPYIKTTEKNKSLNDAAGKHACLAAVQKNYNLTNVKTIGFVRNPWDKVVSWYTYLKCNKSSIHAIEPEISFEEFVVRAPKFVFTESSDFLKSSFGQIDVDFIGRFETIEKDFKAICDQLNIEWSPLPKLNDSNNKTHYSDFYNEKTKQIIENRFSVDIKTFNYTFGS